MLLGALGLVLLITNAAGSGWVAYSSLGLMLFLGIFSGSRTAEISFLMVLALLPFYGSMHKGFNFSRKKFAAGLLLGLAGVALFLSTFSTLTSFLGRNSTLTGRTVIWAKVIEMGVYRPWLGYGFGGFWPEDGNPSKWGMLGSYIKAVNGHNGFLDLWIQLGLLGLVTFLVVFIYSFRKAVKRVRFGNSPDHLWPLVYLTFVVIINLGESELLRHYNIFWTITAATILSLGSQTCKSLSAAVRDDCTPGP